MRGATETVASRRGVALALLLVTVAVSGLGGCSRAPEAARVRDVVHGRPTATDAKRFSRDLPADAVVVEATVSDVRTGPELLVELGDGQETIWVTGFDQAPARASTVRTALLGGPEPHDTLGSVYASSGPLDPDDVVHGFTERGALAVPVGIALGVTLLVPLVGLLFRRGGARRHCPECRRRLDADWRTCPWCGRAQELPQGPASPPTASEGGGDPVSPAPTTASSVPPDGVPPPSGERPTRIVPRD